MGEKHKKMRAALDKMYDHYVERRTDVADMIEAILDGEDEMREPESRFSLGDINGVPVLWDSLTTHLEYYHEGKWKLAKIWYYDDEMPADATKHFWRKEWDVTLTKTLPTVTLRVDAVDEDSASEAAKILLDVHNYNGANDDGNETVEVHNISLVEETDDAYESQQTIKAKKVCDVVVTDPDTGLECGIEVWKEEAGSLVGIDSSYLEGDVGPVLSPYGNGRMVDEDEEDNGL
jgi:hypothetical protein